MQIQDGRKGPNGGLLIVNADDWGQDRDTTERALECFNHGAISSVSAMVFMQDSERAAARAKQQGIDAGLHLNMTTPFSASKCSALLADHQREVARFLLRHRYAQAVFHPRLVGSFEYVVRAQRDEFCRLYGAEPTRLDGHHHMHLCSNVVLGGLLPPGTIVRRNFSFRRREKSWCNRLYRKLVDRMLARRHHLVDFFFSLQPLDRTDHVLKIVALAKEFTVEVDAHPINAKEHRFLTGGEIHRWIGDLPIATRFVAPQRGHEGNRAWWKLSILASLAAAADWLGPLAEFACI